MRAKRNRLQHDVWARKANDSQKLFAIYSNEYIALVTKLMAINGSRDGNRADLAIVAAMTFAANVSSGYSVEDLESIDTEINSVSELLFNAMSQRIMQRLARE